MKINFKCEKCGKVRSCEEKFLVDYQKCCRYCKMKETYKQTCLRKYGIENVLKLKSIIEKKKQTCLQKYGVENTSNLKSVKEKAKKTFQNRYSVNNPSQIENIKNKKKETLKKNFNVDNPMKSQDILKFRKLNCLQKNGVEHPMQLFENKEKVMRTNKQKYGENWYIQSKEAQKYRRQSYIFDNQSFDSKPELAFYIWCKDHNLNIERYVGKGFEYKFENTKHLYFPDFQIDNMLFEIKGNQFLTESGKWKNPYDESKNELYEAKHKCALENNVNIFYEKDYSKFVVYINEKYGHDFFSKYKT